MMKKKLKRVQLDMTEDAFIFLDELKAKTNSSSRAEVVKNAIIFYDHLVDCVREKQDIIARNKEGVEQKIIFPIIG